MNAISKSDRLLDKAIRDGVIDESQIEEFRAMLQGTTLQEEFDRDVKKEYEENYMDEAAIQEALDNFVPDESNPFSIGGRASLPGAFEGGLADVVKTTSVSHLKKHPDYNAAKKQGDGAAALRVVLDRIKPDKVIAELKSRLDPDKPVILVPVMHRDTGEQANMLPLAYARRLKRITGWNLAEDIVKVSGDANTNAPGLARATNEQFFDGPVDPDAQYVLVDDTFTSGDTFVSLYDHIVANGGTVSAATALAASRYHNHLAHRPQDVAKLLDKMGIDREAFADEFGFPIEQLTGSEVYRYANLEKGIDSPASLRSRILKGGNQASGRGIRSGAGATEGSFSIGRATISPTAQTQTYPTKDGGLVGPASFSIGAWHGTPHKVDKFTTAKIGTGEGAQAYGWGLYFADSRKVAEDYKKNLSGGEYIPLPTLKEYFKPRRIVDGDAGKDRVIKFEPGVNAYDWRVTVERVEEQNGEWIATERPRQHATSPDPKKLRALGLETAVGGNLYKVTLNVEDHELLDWDKPLSEQSKEVRKSLSKIATGGDPDLVALFGEDLITQGRTFCGESF